MTESGKIEGRQLEPAKMDRAARRAICDECPSNTKGGIPTCAHCGCVLAIITNLKGRCPQRKW